MGIKVGVREGATVRVGLVVEVWVGSGVCVADIMTEGVTGVIPTVGEIVDWLGPIWQDTSRITTPKTRRLNPKYLVTYLAIERIIRRFLLTFILFLSKFIRGDLILGGLPIIRSDQNTTTAHFSQA